MKKTQVLFSVMLVATIGCYGCEMEEEGTHLSDNDIEQSDLEIIASIQLDNGAEMSFHSGGDEIVVDIAVKADDFDQLEEIYRLQEEMENERTTATPTEIYEMFSGQEAPERLVSLQEQHLAKLAAEEIAEMESAPMDDENYSMSMDSEGATNDDAEDSIQSSRGGVKHEPGYLAWADFNPLYCNYMYSSLRSLGWEFDSPSSDNFCERSRNWCWNRGYAKLQFVILSAYRGPVRFEMQYGDQTYVGSCPDNSVCFAWTNGGRKTRRNSVNCVGTTPISSERYAHVSSKIYDEHKFGAVPVPYFPFPLH